MTLFHSYFYSQTLFFLIAASDMNCFRNIMQDFDDQIRNCSCEVDCEENDYDNVKEGVNIRTKIEGIREAV